MNIYLSLLKFHIGFYESCFTSLKIYQNIAILDFTGMIITVKPLI